MTAEPTVADMEPHARTRAWADHVASVAARPTTPAATKAPPRAVFRDSAAGGRAWLAAAERTLKLGP
jgi:hypothetical protein